MGEEAQSSKLKAQGKLQNQSSKSSRGFAVGTNLMNHSVVGNLPDRRRPSAHGGIDPGDRLLVPEGHRRKLAGGKTAPAGAAPGWRTKRAMPQRGIGEVFRAACSQIPGQSLLASRRTGNQHPAPIIARPQPESRPISSMPRGARSHSPRVPGAASAAADLPPANLLRRPSGTRTGPLLKPTHAVVPQQLLTASRNSWHLLLPLSFEL